jgi:hypothetical protein
MHACPPHGGNMPTLAEGMTRFIRVLIDHDEPP